MTKTRLLWWFPALGWAAGIYLLSTRPADQLPNVEIPGLDKVVHFGLFAVLALLLLLALRKAHALRPLRAAAIAFVLASLYGGSDEIHQLFTPSRSSDPLDWVADSAGASLAFVAVFLTRRGPEDGP